MLYIFDISRWYQCLNSECVQSTFWTHLNIFPILYINMHSKCVCLIGFIWSGMTNTRENQRWCGFLPPCKTLFYKIIIFITFLQITDNFTSKIFKAKVRVMNIEKVMNFFNEPLFQTPVEFCPNGKSEKIGHHNII